MEDWSCGAIPSKLWPFFQPWPWHEHWWGWCPWPRAHSPWHWVLLCPDAMQGHQPGSGAPCARQAPEQLQVWDLSWLLCSVLVCSHPSQHQFSQGTKNCLKTDFLKKKRKPTKEDIPLLCKQAQPTSPTWGLPAATPLQAHVEHQGSSGRAGGSASGPQLPLRAVSPC